MNVNSEYSLLNYILLPFKIKKGKQTHNAPVSNPIPNRTELCSSQTSKAVSDTMNALININSEYRIFPKSTTISEVHQKTKNLVELYNYTYQNPLLTDFAQQFDDFAGIIDDVYTYSVKTDFNLKDRLPALNRLTDFGTKPENKELFDKIGKDLFECIFIHNEDYLSQFSKSALNNVNRIMNNESLMSYKLSLKDHELMYLLSEKTNNSLISKNISVIEKAIKHPEYAFLKDIDVIDPKILRYNGDLQALLGLLKEKNASLKNGEKLSFAIDYISGESKIIIKKDEGKNLIFKKGFYYDRNLNCTATLSSIEGQNLKGQRTLNTTIKDCSKNSEFRTRELFDAERKVWVLQSHIQEERDAAGKLIRREIIKTSNVEGAYNIKVQDSQGRIHTKSTATRNSEGTTIVKNLVSPDGTVSKIRYRLSPNGQNEAFGYQISDSSGNILAQKTDYKKHISDSHITEEINGKKYKITLFKDEIMVYDETANKYTKLDMKKISGGARHTFKNILKQLPAPELISMSENLVSLEQIADKDSYFTHFDRKISSAADAYVLEHEYGHCKNAIKQNIGETHKLVTFAPNKIEYKIASDKTLQKIFAEEKKAFDAFFPKPVREFTNYFTSNLPLKGEFSCRLGEVNSEFNALKNMAYIPEWIMKRAHFLQENFPRTAAYLLKYVL